MANSIGRPVDHPGGTLRHAKSGSRIDISSGPEGMRHRLEHAGLVANQLIDYFVGSGNKGRSYLVNIHGRLFQSPASYYSDRKLWDVSPGFENEQELDFDRPTTPDCLFCHSGRARPAAFTLNSYESPAFASEAITCERCHGAPDLHLAQPSRSNIVNPRKLKPHLRDAVCDQCHLGGEARILNPGRQFWDYKPGDPLESVFTVYVPDRRRDNSREPLKVVSHSEQLAASKCAQESGGRMWCGTCHDPHRKPAQPASWYAERCKECHSTGSLVNHKNRTSDCAGCHMPSRRSYDGGHTAFTDHRILAKAGAGESPPSIPEVLRAWREPSTAVVATRNLGLAYISVGERYQSARHLNEGFRLLSQVQTRMRDDPATLTSLGVVLQKKSIPKEAARVFSRVIELESGDARHRLNLAVALAEGGELQPAIRALESAISLDPSLRDAYLLLSEIYDRTGDREKSRTTLQRYLQFMPQSTVVRRRLSRD